MDYLVDLAEKALRKRPSAVTFVAPLVAYVFTLFAGTGHVAYAILPVIAEVSREAGVRPERPALHLGDRLAAGHHREPHLGGDGGAARAPRSGERDLLDILWRLHPGHARRRARRRAGGDRRGEELADDPEYQRRLAAGGLDEAEAAPPRDGGRRRRLDGQALGGPLPVRRRRHRAPGVLPRAAAHLDVRRHRSRMGMAHAIEMVMLSVAALMVLFCKANVDKVANGSVFRAGMQAVIAIFGIAWMGDTFFQSQPGGRSRGRSARWCAAAPWLFAVALFVMSILLYSQAATVRALDAARRRLGLPPFGAHRHVPGGERLLLPAQLPDAGGGHQLRPHRHHPHREVAS